MSETVNLPALGESVTEGTITRWLVEVGDEVEVDQPIVEVSTDKVDTEVPSPVAGTVAELLVAEDETVEVGEPLIKIGDQSEGSAEDEGDDDAAAEEAATEAEEPEETQQAAEEEAPVPAAGESGGGEATPEEDSPAGDTGGESQEVTLPALGESVTEGTVTRWLVEVGDEVEVDQPLLEVSTDKVDTEVPSPVAGTVQELKVSEDETVEVGAVLALVGSGAAPAVESEEPTPEAEKASEPEPAPASEKEPEPEPEPAPEKEPEPSEAPEKEGAEPKAEAGSKDEQSSKSTPTDTDDTSAEGYVTPIVRRLAKNEGVDLSEVKGTGVGGRIRKQDVLDAAQTKKSETSAEESPASSTAAPQGKVDTAKRGTTEKAPRIRQVIAQRMNESLDISAQLTQVHEVDMTRIVNLRAKAKTAFKEQNGANLTYLAFIAVAVTEALKQHPVLNAEYSQDQKQITYHDSEHLSFAVDTEKGLMVPVIADAGDLSLAGMAKKISDVAKRTRENKIAPEELSGGTFTITNLGSFGALFDTPIINQPQVAILGPGAIVKRPMVVTDADGQESIGIRHMMYLSLTYDHRIVDGADAGRFLQTLKGRLEEGSFEAQLGL
ncbi:2-oxoglutarate dehydrogenase, E2 component, dihydrolipoamide succinyltransferase [Nesterenkonia natronophila]|uniref:Dihydrolipoamide acetyltransferase component of pyruvate dehydrogenase complex n=1 Tax=Nesterenkonia natronophila TaxID=2174932 RepID=A0A3A4EZD9_9MICC|nr:2-oxoglutarate dehydrogenase, E2 component, dihydrolipoamide succinyltransferase [Nesterenkonia natronophila]RJN31272.1 2-oxoglutarate dehydrogenase, E2 component, dihydrolipoamide succinyltransferase [Nesterenkonia natronophila]